MQSVSKKLRNDENLSRERQSLYFRFRHRVSKSKKLPYKLLRIFCTGFAGVSVSETLHYPSKRILTVPMTGLKPVSTIPFNAFGNECSVLNYIGQTVGKRHYRCKGRDMCPKGNCNFGHRNVQNFLFKNLCDLYRNINGYKKNEAQDKEARRIYSFLALRSKAI